MLPLDLLYSVDDEVDWSDYKKLCLACEFIHLSGNAEEFEKFIQRQIERESRFWTNKNKTI